MGANEMRTIVPFLSEQALQVLPDMDAPPPAPWGGDGIASPGQSPEPQPEEDPVPVEEPWTDPKQPIRDPGSMPQRWRLH